MKKVIIKSLGGKWALQPKIYIKKLKSNMRLVEVALPQLQNEQCPVRKVGA